MPLTNVTRAFLIDVAGVLDTPLKLVTIKNLKNEQLQDNVNNYEKLVKQFLGGIFRGANFLCGNFMGGNYLGAILRG